MRLWDPATGAPVGDPLTGHTNVVTGCAFGTRPDGTLLLATTSTDRTVRPRDPATGTPIGDPLTGHTGPGDRVRVRHPPRRHPAAGHHHAASTGRCGCGTRPPAQPVGNPQTGHTNVVTGCAFGTRPDGTLLLATTSRDETVRLWNPLIGSPIGDPMTGHTSEVTGCAFGTRPDGTLLLATTSRDETVRLWNPANGSPKGDPMTGHTNVVTGCAFGTRPDGTLLLATTSHRPDGAAVGPGHRHAQIVDPLTGDTGPGDRVRVRHPPRRHPAAGHHQHRRDGAARRDPATDTPVGDPLRDTNVVTGCAFGTRPDSTLLLATTSRGQTVRPVEPSKRLPDRGPDDRPHQRGDRVRVRHPPRRHPAAGHHQSRRDGAAVEPSKRLPDRGPTSGHTSEVTGCAFATRPDGTPLLATTSTDRTVRRRDPATGNPLGHPLSGHTSEVTGCAFATRPDGTLLLATTSFDQTLRLWDPATGDWQALAPSPLQIPWRVASHGAIVVDVRMGSWLLT